jgi:hypothetical protein
MRFRTFLTAFLLGLIAFLVYRYTAAPDVLTGDAGEFQFTLPLAGISHPTGYPLYHVLGSLWERLYVANPAQGANYFSAFWGGVAVFFFYWLSYEALSQLLAHLKWRNGATFLAILTTVVFAGNPTFWAQSTLAEVYALNAALMAGILAAALRLRPWRSDWTGQERRARGSLWLVFLLLGLGLAHHLTFILLIPGLILYLIMVRPEALSGRSLLRMAPFLLLPLLLYLYLPLRATASPWLYPELAPGQTLNLFDNSAMGILRFALGTGFAPALSGPGMAWAQIPTAANLFLLHFGWAGIALMVVGIIALIFEDQLPNLILTGVCFICLVGFNLFYNIGDIHTFYIPTYIIATLWLGMGLTYAVDLLTRILGNGFRPYLLALTTAVLLIPFLHFQNYRSEFDRSRDYEARQRWEIILDQPLADNAILVSNDRDEIVPLVYLQQIERRAQDMLGLFPLISPDPGWSDLNTTLSSSLDSGRSVYTIKTMPGIEALYQVEAMDGDLTHVVDRQLAPDPSFEMPYGDYLRWLNLDWWGDAVPGGVMTVVIYWRVTETPPTTWHSFLQIYNEAGEKIKQADDHRPGGDYLPSSLWRPGNIVVDSFVMPLPDVLPPGGYTLVAGFYDPETGERMADPLPVATLISPSSRPAK